MRDVAALAGVAPSTVSRALAGHPTISDATTARVERAALELNYTGANPLARALRTGRTHVIGVATSQTHWRFTEDPLTSAVTAGLIRGIAEHGYGALFIPYSNDESGVATVEGMVGLTDAVIVASTYIDRNTVIERLLSGGAKVVVIETEELFAAPGVTLDDRAAVRELMGRARELGHRRAAVVSLPLGDGDTRREDIAADPTPVRARHARARLQGVLDASIEITAVWQSVQTTRAEGDRLGRMILASGEVPTLIVCQSDRLAHGVIQALAEAGLQVPRDVSVTGFDALSPAHTGGIEITSISQDGVRKGALAAEGAVELAEGRTWSGAELPLKVRRGDTLAAAPVQ